MGTPAIADDAARITDRGRTGNVVETLIAPANEQIIQLGVDQVRAHPRNPKDRVRDVDDLKASIADLGIQTPLVVATADAYNNGRLDGEPALTGVGLYVIVAGGHRRHRAAAELGLPTVPCVVRDHLADAKGRRAALFENLHRRQLTAFEEAEAYGELVHEYKISQRDLATVVGCNQSHISKRLKLLKLPSTVRAAVGVTISIEGAIEFAKVADQGPIFDAAWQLFSNNRWMEPDRAVKTAIANHESKVRREKAQQELADSGVTILDKSRPAYSLYNKKDACQLESTGIKTERHAGEECHAAHIESDGEIVYVCTSPGRHFPDGKSKVKIPKAKREYAERSGGSSDADKAKRRLNKQLREIRDDRRAYVRSLLSGEQAAQLTAGDWEDFERLAIRCQLHKYAHSFDITGELLAVTAPKDRPWEISQPAGDALLALPDGQARLVLCVSSIEQAMTVTWSAWGLIERSYLTLLEQFGRPMLDPEHERLGDKPRKDGTWEIAAGTDTAAEVEADETVCRICGCTDSHACDGGCTWVEADLCSTCDAAIEAGLVDGEQPLAEVAG